MGSLFAKTPKPPPTDGKPGDQPVSVPSAWCELDVTGTPPEGNRKPDGALGHESLATLGDFVWQEGEPRTVADLCNLLRSSPRAFTPYCLDHIRRRVILVGMDPKNLEDGFFYQKQRQHATRVLAVPYKVMVEAAEQLGAADGKWAERVIFLHSTGRCGSTLLSKLLGAAHRVVSLSEPDIFSYATWVASRRFYGADEATSPDLLRAVTWLLHVHAALTPDAVVCVKVRSQVIELAEAMQKGVPGSKSLCLYRDPIDTMDSFCMAFFSGFVNRQLRWWNLDTWVLYKASDWPNDFAYLAPLLASGDPRFREEVYKQLGFVGLVAMGWLSVMDKAMRLQRTKFFAACVRYEDLCAHRARAAEAVLEACGCQGAALDDAAVSSVFDEDAHGQTAQTRSRRRERGTTGPIYITDHDIPLLRELMGSHEELTKAGNVLPGTLTF